MVRSIPRKYDQVNHSNDEYARYEHGVCISTNNVEGFFFSSGESTAHITTSANSIYISKVAGRRLMYKDIVPDS
jgi:hypothetical protein